MEKVLIAGLRARTPEIQRRWQALLHVEPVDNPLANPDILAFMIPSSIEQLLAALATPAEGNESFPPPVAAWQPPCRCGCNPYLPYYKAGEQALLEALVLVQADLKRLEQREEELREFYAVVRRLATEEITAFCGVCTNRTKTPECRFAPAALTDRPRQSMALAIV